MGNPADELRADVVQTRAAYRQALQRFREIIDEVPSGQQIEGTSRIAQAGQQVRTAIAKYMGAVRRENGFMVSRAIGDGSDLWRDSE